MKFDLKIFLIFSFTLVSTGLFSQNENTEPYSFSEIIAEKGQNDEFIYVHKIKKGETVYRLARLFNLKSIDIFKINPRLQNTIISIGEKVKIPLNNDFISSQVELNEDYKNAIPVIYEVQPKDNLFRISRVYFNQPLINLTKRNNIEGLELSIGQKLTVGWIMKGTTELEVRTVPTKQQQLVFEKIIQKSEEEQKYSESDNGPKDIVIVKDSGEEINHIEKISGGSKEEILTNPGGETLQDESGGNITESEDGLNNETIEVENNKVEEKAIEVIKKPSYIVRRTKGLAIWKKDSADTENLFALHATARVNTMIEITNPMLNRKVLAKVIGNLPKNSYPESVTLVVTPKVASDLGVIDSRFFVEIRYLE